MKASLAGPGSCDARYFTFPVDSQGISDWPHAVRVIQQKTPVYINVSSNVSERFLEFGDAVEVEQVTDSRVEVKDIGDYQTLGWVDRSALLCGLTPLRGKNGYEKILFVKATVGGPENSSAAVTACSEPDLEECDRYCQELSGVNAYFVFAQTETAYLLSDAFRLGENAQLVGWIAKEDGIIWDTAYGIRPSEELTFPSGHLKAGEERSVCVYETLEDALHKQDCYPFLGGMCWYQSSFRLPLLERLDVQGTLFYKILFPVYKVIYPTFETYYQTVREGYIEVSEDVVEDVWLTSSSFNTWTILLNSLAAVMTEGTEIRGKFLFALQDSFEKVLGTPLYGDSQQRLQQYVRQAGLPVRADSPLFRYSLADLSDPDIVPDCELRRLQSWLEHVTQILGIVAYGDARPVYTQEEFPGACPTGEDIPYIVSDIRPAPLGKDPSMRYDHNFQKAHIYWVPEEFLP